MRLRILSPSDLWSGVLYVTVGLAAIWLGSDYRMGNAGRIGPGYFPKVIATMLILLGAAAIIRAFALEGPRVTGFSWKPLGLVVLGTVLFALVLQPLGLVVAVPALVLTSATASNQFRIDWRAIMGVVLLTALCSVVFVIGLGVPMPIVGWWLAPYFSTLVLP